MDPGSVGGFLVSIKTEPEDAQEWEEDEQHLEEENLKKESFIQGKEGNHANSMKVEPEEMLWQAEDIGHQVKGILQEDNNDSTEEHFDISIWVKMEDAILEGDREDEEDSKTCTVGEDGDSGLDVKGEDSKGTIMKMKKEQGGSPEEFSGSEDNFTSGAEEEECNKTSSDEKNCQSPVTAHSLQKCSFCNAEFSGVLLTSVTKSKNCSQTHLKCKVCDRKLSEKPVPFPRRNLQASSNVLKQPRCGGQNSDRIRNGKVNEMGSQRNSRCKFCKKVLPDKAAMNLHYLRHCSKNPFKCQYCGEVFTTTNNLKKHEKLHAPKTSHNCRYCDKTFERHANLIRHEKSHVRSRTGGKPYKCKVCGSGFKRLFDLKIHEKIHFVGKTYKCQFCDKAFVRKNTLKRHEQVHTGEKPFKCQVCDKCFRRPYYLKAHKCLHAGVKPFVCEICGRSYSYKETLKYHEITHRDKEKPFKCRYCDQVFSEKNAWVRHERSSHLEERPHLCQVCFKRFKTKYDLAHHNMLHTDNKPFKCKYCDKKYTKMSHLKRHEMTHSGEEPFKCDRRRKGSSRKRVLNIHKETDSAKTT